MTFREIRDHKFKILFMYYFLKTDIDSVLSNYFDLLPYEEEDDENTYVSGESKSHLNVAKVTIKEGDNREFNVSDAAVTITPSDEDNRIDIKNKIKDLITKTDGIDELIKKSLNSWDINRVGKAELAIIRLAVYEMFYDNSIDLPVAINEAVELSKVYCDDKAAKFVNGVLATIVKNNDK